MRIKLKTNEETINFLKERNVKEPEIPWICPKCDFENYIRWSKRTTPCGNCDFQLHGSGVGAQIKELTRELEQVKDRISELEDEICGYENDALEIQHELKLLKRMETNS